MSHTEMRTLCPQCECFVDSFGPGDDAIRFSGQVFHKACIDLNELENDELEEIGTPEAQNVLDMRCERAHQEWIEQYYGGSGRQTMDEISQAAWAEHQETHRR